MKVIVPNYSKNAITLAKDVVDLVKGHCKPFGGDVAKVLSCYKTQAGVMSQRAYAKDTLADKHFKLQFDFDDENEELAFFGGVGGLFSAPVEDYLFTVKAKRPFRASAEAKMKEAVEKLLEPINKSFDEKLNNLVMEYFGRVQKELDKFQKQLDEKKLVFASAEEENKVEAANPEEAAKFEAMKKALEKAGYTYKYDYPYEGADMKSDVFRKKVSEGTIRGSAYSKGPSIYFVMDAENSFGKTGFITLYHKNDNFNLEKVPLADVEPFVEKEVKKIENLLRTEAKKWIARHKGDVSRKTAMDVLKRANPKAQIKTSEDFDSDTQGGIWLVGYQWENLIADLVVNKSIKTRTKLSDYGDIYDLDGCMEGFMEHEFCDIFNLKGWKAEWYDSGTLMLYPDND